MKNIAGALTVTGAGAAAGCPWLAGVLIGLGVGSSWVGGVGLIIAGVGIGLWIFSTYLSVSDSPAGNQRLFEFTKSILMGGGGILHVILSPVYYGIRSCCCGEVRHGSGSRTAAASDRPPVAAGFVIGIPGFGEMPKGTADFGTSVDMGFGTVPLAPGFSAMPPVDCFTVSTKDKVGNGSLPGFGTLPNFGSVPEFGDRPVRPQLTHANPEPLASNSGVSPARSAPSVQAAAPIPAESTNSIPVPAPGSEITNA